MIRLAEIARHYQTQLTQQFGQWMRPEHTKALEHIITCHTPACGELLYYCEHCHHDQTYYPCCGDRHCPTCQHHQNSNWLIKQQQKLLPVDYYMVTFTLPHELNPWVWHHQKSAYSFLFKAAKATLASFFKKDKDLGEYAGLVGVLHTHSRQLKPHYHVHFIVPAGGFDKAKRQFKSKTGDYLFKDKNLAKVFRGKYIELLMKTGLRFPSTAKKWIANCEYVGQGDKALTYLSRYLYRSVISENNILSWHNDEVTFQYKNSSTKQFEKITESAVKFLWRVLQHVLPRGFQRTRSYGFLHGNAKHLLQRLQLILKVKLAPLPEQKEHIAWTRHCPECDGLMDILMARIGRTILPVSSRCTDAFGQ